MFAAIRERYGIDRDDNLKLRDYPTLRHVVGFVEDRTGTTAPAARGRRPRPPPAPAAGRARGRAARRRGDHGRDPGDRRRADRLPGRHARPRPRPRSRPRHRHRQTGRDVRRHPRALRHRPRRHPQAARLPHPAPRRRLRRRPRPRHARRAAPPKPRRAPDAEPRRRDAAAFPRRVPVPVLRPPLERARDRRDARRGQPRRADARSGGVATALASGSPSAASTCCDSTQRSAARRSSAARRVDGAGPIHGVYWLPALDDEGAARRARRRRGWREALRVRVKLLAVHMRDAARDARFLVAGTRLGGRHGYDAAGATRCMGGAVTGFTKALARERPDALDQGRRLRVRPQDRGAADILHRGDAARPRRGRDRPRRRACAGRSALIERAGGRRPGARAHAGHRRSSSPARPAASCPRSPPTSPRPRGGTFHLLDLVPRARRRRPGPRALRHRPRRPQARPRRAHPRRAASARRRSSSSASSRGSSAPRAALAAIAAIERAGGSAHWHQVDLTDAGRRRRPRWPGIERVDVLMHAAGLEISHFLPDKPQAEFDLVFDVKADGWFNLLRALRGTPSRQRRRRSARSPAASATPARPTTPPPTTCSARASRSSARGGTRGIAIDWTAWAEHRHGQPRLDPEDDGGGRASTMLPPEVGVPVVRRELDRAGAGGEVLVAGALGVLLEERHATGGLDPERAGGAGPMTRTRRRP